MSTPEDAGTTQEDDWERSRILWRQAAPAPEWCTWGMEVSGEAFVTLANTYGAFAPEKAILEVGPGYARLLRECIRQALPFKRYVAVDISPLNVEYLTKEFDRPDVQGILADIETVSLDERFDTVLSSLTFKHLYPSFEAALRNVAEHLNPEALVIFDLIEGQGSEFPQAEQIGRIAYNRAYSRAEVEEILDRVTLELVGFDEVRHTEEQVRLLVVARKPG
jgi:SAM-dependent methyltransferase